MARTRHHLHQSKSTYFDFPPSPSLFGPHIFSISSIAPDSDPIVDDWHAFAGNPAYYGSPTTFLYAIANTSVSRAKRAFASGKTWEEFEREERRGDSMALARGEVDPVRKRLLVQEGLDNGLRLRVLAELKGRLRAEIWGESEKREMQQEESENVARRVDSPTEKDDCLDEERTVERFLMGPGRRVVVEWREEGKEAEM